MGLTWVMSPHFAEMFGNKRAEIEVFLVPLGIATRAIKQ
jgi:hypothetical protein